MIDVIKRYFNSTASFSKNIKYQEKYYSELLYKLFLSKSFLTIYDSVNVKLSEIFSAVKYIAPLRASSERYYRYQDLQIDEIDSTGSNLAMVLRSLSRSEQSNFAQWIQNFFGFSVRIREQGLHCEIIIQTDDASKEYNISDMGFGFSQILPIITSIWLESNNKSRNLSRLPKNIIFAIEQPELHLHPEFQHKLGMMLANIAKSSRDIGVNLKIVIETHSRTLINSIGEAIENNIIDNEDVSITVFEKVGESSKVQFSRYNPQGYLENWPIGFFAG